MLALRQRVCYHHSCWASQLLGFPDTFLRQLQVLHQGQHALLLVPVPERLEDAKVEIQRQTVGGGAVPEQQVGGNLVLQFVEILLIVGVLGLHGDDPMELPIQPDILRHVKEVRQILLLLQVLLHLKDALITAAMDGGPEGPHLQHSPCLIHLPQIRGGGLCHHGALLAAHQCGGRGALCAHGQHSQPGGCHV